MVYTGHSLKELAVKSVHPLDEKQISKDSVDLTISTRIKVVTPQNSVTLSNGDFNFDKELEGIKSSDNGWIEFVPGKLYLAYTREYLVLPSNVLGLINLRSYAARAGLLQATALKISPGFRGYPILELTTSVPLKFQAGEPLIQLILYRTTDRTRYSGKYYNQQAGA